MLGFTEDAAVCRRPYHGNMHDVSFHACGSAARVQLFAVGRAEVGLRLAPGRWAELEWKRGQCRGGQAVSLAVGAAL